MLMLFFVTGNIIVVMLHAVNAAAR
jgi:hypothetical protein